MSIQMLTEEQKQKLDRLKAYIGEMESLAVGFSGGVDSSFLLYVAHEVLGDRVIAVTETDAFVPERESDEAKEFCEKYGIRQIVFTADMLSVEEYRNNSPDRCYICKRRIFSEIKRIAEENGISDVAEGSNLDDTGDYRPGMKAAEELSVKCPLKDVGFTKSDIRLISKAMDLPTWSKPSYACLASRFVYGEEITADKLRMIDKAEQFLIELGFLEERVRLHGSIARIEVPGKDISRLASDEIREEVFKKFKEIGFTFVTLDMGGYRTGSMNSTIHAAESVNAYTTVKMDTTVK